MTPAQLKTLERELDDYIDWLTDRLGRSERREALGLYLTGLLLDGERKSVEPLAARLVDDQSEVEASSTGCSTSTGSSATPSCRAPRTSKWRAPRRSTPRALRHAYVGDHERVYLPMGYRRLTIHAPLERVIYVRVRFREDVDPSGQTITFDVVFMNAAGDVVVRPR